MGNINSQKHNAFVPKKTPADQAKDTGMALVLICLLIGHFYQTQCAIIAGIIILVANMIKPDIFLPAAKLWLGLSHFIGTVMSAFILAIVFFLVITPVGVLRRIVGIDPMQLKKWKKDSSSVFKILNNKFVSQDIEKPY